MRWAVGNPPMQNAITCSRVAGNCDVNFRYFGTGIVCRQGRALPGMILDAEPPAHQPRPLFHVRFAGVSEVFMR